MNWILFGFYIACILILFAFISIVIMHIGEFRQYSRYINPVLRAYVVLILLIAVFGGYQVLTNETPAVITDSTPQNIKLEF